LFLRFFARSMGFGSLEDTATGKAVILDDNGGHVHLRRVGYGRRRNRVVPV
jgi:hypothetical protein